MAKVTQKGKYLRVVTDGPETVVIGFDDDGELTVKSRKRRGSTKPIRSQDTDEDEDEPQTFGDMMRRLFGGDDE